MNVMTLNYYVEYLVANRLRVYVLTFHKGDGPLPRHIEGDGGLDKTLISGLDVPVADI